MRSIYELWMQQSRDFFVTANESLKGLFANNRVVDPEEHFLHIQEWLENMKQQWQMVQATQEQQEYWNSMIKICVEGADMMLLEWGRLVRDDKPVHSIQELYQLWLNCCHEVYQKSLQTKSFQDTYGEFMNKAFRFWKNAVPTN